MSDFKVGDVLTPKRNSVFYGVRKDIRLVCRHEVSGRAAWLVEANYEHSDSCVDMATEPNLREFWEKKKSFFKMGYKYKFDSTDRLTYEILDLHSVENPISDKLFAIAMKTNSAGQQSIARLVQFDFDRMREVK